MNEPSQERADPSARSLGSLFCNIHFVSNSIKLRQLYVTEFSTDENQFFQPIKYELGKVLCMFLCLSLASYPCPSYFLGHDVPSVARAWGQRGPPKNGSANSHPFDANFCQEIKDDM